MNNDNPFFMNFTISEFMNRLTIPTMDNALSKKLMGIHQKNLDAFVAANKVVSDGYRSIATKQMEICQYTLIKMAGFTPEQTATLAQNTFADSMAQMKTLLDTATNSHRQAFDILSARANDLANEAKV